MHKFLIGINRDLSSGLEKFLGDINYEKLTEDDIAYFKFVSESKDTPELTSYLQLHAGEENYGFVRLGNKIDDTEVSGNLENFDMVIHRSAEIL
jgi:hypothetical protein